MATGNSNAIYTAGEMQNTGAFSFNTTNVNVVSYIPSLDMCPTKALITAAVRTGYTVTIPTSYNAKQLVRWWDVDWKKNIGKLTIRLYSSSYLTSQGDSSLWLVHFGSRPQFTDTKIHENASYLYCQADANNGGFNSSTTSITMTLITYETPTWPTSGTNLVFLSYVCYTNDGGAAVLNGFYTSSEASQLNSGTNVTAGTWFTVTYVSAENWHDY